MSSDNENSKQTDDETHSDKESFSDEQKYQKKDRKKKLKTKELLRSPSKVKDAKDSPGTCNFGKENIILDDKSDSTSDEKPLCAVGDNPKHKKTKQLPRSPAKAKIAKSNPGPSGTCFVGKDTNVVEDNLDSNSDEKLVGVVGDNIKHLNLRGVKDGEIEPPTDVASQDIRSFPIVEYPVSANIRDVQQLPVNEQDSLVNASVASLLTTSTGLEVVRGEVPHNTLHEPGVPQEVKTDLQQLPTSTLAYKRKTLFHKDDTLDDVSEITTDLTDIQSDSNSIPTSGRRLSQTSSDAIAEGLSGSLESENKESANETKNKYILPNKNTSKSDEKESKKDKSEKIDTSNDNIDVAQVIKKKNVPANHDKCGDGDRAKKVVKKRVSNGHCNEQSMQDGDFKDCCDLDLNQQQNISLDDKEITNKQAVQESSFCPVQPDLCSGSSQLMMEDDNNESEIVEHGYVEPVEEQDISEHVDLEGQENDQIDIQNDEDLNNELGDSSAQDGLNNESEQGSNSDFQNFARGQYVGFRVDSTTTDSGIENSLAMFDRNNIQDVPDTSLSNEASALGSSGASGLQNLQNWIDRGAAVNMSRASSISPLPEVNEEEIAGPSNVMEQQAGPSKSSAMYVKGKVLKVAQLEVIEDSPMECAEHFAETQPEGSILEIIPGIPCESEDLITDEDKNKFKPLVVPMSDLSKQSTEPNNSETGNSDATESPSKKVKEHILKTSSLKKGAKENSELTEDKESTPCKEAATSDQISSMNPNTSQRLAKDDSDLASSSSREQSRESSLADMEDAIESSDSLGREAEPQQTAASWSNVLQGILATSSPILASEPGLKPQRSKRRAKKSSENQSPFKRRKDMASCGQQASSLESLKKEKPDSDDESSKEGQNVEM